MSADIRWCAMCTTETVFEAPPCEDGHGLDCLDVACVECGHALVLGVLVEKRTVLVVAQAA